MVVKEKRGAATLDFCRHESKKLDSCLAAGIPEARLGPERLRQENDNPRHRPFRLVANQFFVLRALSVSDSPPFGSTARRSFTHALSSRGAVLHLYVQARRLPATNEVP